MLALQDLSLRHKVPLRSTVLILITAVLVTASLLYRDRDELRRDLHSTAEDLGRVLAATLVPALLHDDLWKAFETVNLVGAPADHGFPADFAVVLDPRYRVYVSNQPERFPVLANPVEIDPTFMRLVEAAREIAPGERSPAPVEDAERIYAVFALASDGVPLGTLVLGYPKSHFGPRFWDRVTNAALTTLIVIAVIVPVTWYWGARIADPLVRLSDCMERMSRQPLDELDCDLLVSRDEIGQLGARFREMHADLKRKEELERQVVAADRLAAIGRITAGIAHEINNPLGGMLNAISTYRQYGNDDPRTRKTMSMLERGLRQIRDTVRALLVEAKVESHPVTHQDLEDIRTLIASDVAHKNLRFSWDNALMVPIDMPSTYVRQVLLNLLLNAAHAAEPGGVISCRIEVHGHHLTLVVHNSGAHIPADRVPLLFEPFASGHNGGHGLGLWVTYQIVEQLHGAIQVDSEPGDTRFRVYLPIPEADA